MEVISSGRSFDLSTRFRRRIDFGVTSISSSSAMNSSPFQ